VLDELLKRGVPLETIAGVGALAFNVVADGLITEEEVQAAGNG
jgi:hypothetical protein